MGFKGSKILNMKVEWREFPYLKLNGQCYSLDVLLHFSKTKLESPKLPSWERSIFSFVEDFLDKKDEIELKTSGSTGKPKLIRLKKKQMIASARTTNSYFGLDSTKKALLCLPADFIAGKMMILRALVGGFDLYYQEPSSDSLSKINEDFDFTAVVPMQLDWILKNQKEKVLERIDKVIVGGAALSQKSQNKIQELKTQFWATYGMTETITHIALQKLNGKDRSDYFIALPEVSFKTDSRNCLRIYAPRISSEPVQTNDRVKLISPSQFLFLGREDFIINSGGLKFSPEILEQKIFPLLDADFVFSALSDSVLGEKLVLVIEGESKEETVIARLARLLENKLNRHELPKQILFMKAFPRTASGKIDRRLIKVAIS
jgi:O-succinylbenzoic acid--CoA ligase